MAPSETMLESAAYRRMKAENPSEFVPRSVFFARDGGSGIDRRNSLWVKAALVYESVTGRHVDDGAKPLATSLLLALARACGSRAKTDGATTAMTDVLSKAVSGAMAISATSDAGAGGGDVESEEKKTAGGGDVESEEKKTAGGGDVESEEKKTAGGGDVESEEKKTAAAELPDDDDEGTDYDDDDEGTDYDDEADDDEGTDYDDEDKRVIDAVFLVVGFLTRLVEAAAGLNRDAVDEGFRSTHMQDIVADVIKLENQLPLERILAVVERVQDAVRHVGATDARFEPLRERLQGYQLGFTAATFFDDVVRPFCWYYSPFFNRQLPAVDRAQYDDDHERTLLDFLHATVVPTPPGAEKGAAGGGKTSRMPTARELSRSGVRIAPGEDGRAAVKFDEASARLQLPALVYDFKLATVARNLLAREYPEQSKPVTRYFQMMNELVDEAADAKILHRTGAVRGGGASGAEVHDLVKRIDVYATYPSVFMAMDVQIEKVRRFHDKRMQNFLVRYRPGVIWASSVAAVSLVAIVAARRRG